MVHAFPSEADGLAVGTFFGNSAVVELEDELPPPEFGAQAVAPPARGSRVHTDGSGLRVPSRAFSKFESYGMLETAASRG